MVLRILILAALLYSQDPALVADPWQEETAEHEQLEQDHRATIGGSQEWLVTVVAQFQDGTPARGHINCDDLWCKYDEAKHCAQNLPFETDARGVCIFNPPYHWYNDDNPMVCYATSGTRSGKLVFTPSDGGRFVITIP